MNETSWTECGIPYKEKAGDQPKEQVKCKGDSFPVVLKKRVHCCYHFDAAKIPIFQKSCENR
ncbi:MAG: hypothetical protein J6X98_09810 [Bacteroidales bacterium]|nr:hypothetical protein [Bacteroidales bacterium]